MARFICSSPDCARIVDAESLPPACGACGRPLRLARDTADRTEYDSLSVDLPHEIERLAIGRYGEAYEIARGGMGAILEAHDPALNRTVAIKVVRAGPGASADRLAKFLREAQITGQLEHPNIVPVHELDHTEDGEPYFTMKRVRGTSLREILEEQDDTLAVRSKLLHVFLKICDAVGYAHARGVIHRDLKPANIMVGEFGEVLVMDWGLARVVGDVEEPIALDGTDLLPGAGATLDGQIVGTPAYMSPEQTRGETDVLDERSDLYALGAILYEILTRRPAFGRGSLVEVLARVEQGAFEAPSDVDPDRPIPRELEAVCLRAMSRQPQDRYATVAALRADVEAYLGGRMVGAVRYNPAQRMIKWLARHPIATAALAAGLLALAAGVLGAGALQESAVARQVEGHTASATRLLAAHRPEDAREECVRALALDPDDERAHSLLEESVLAVEASRGQARIKSIRLDLGRARAAGATAQQAGDRPAWYARISRALNLAREWNRLAPRDRAARAAVAELALELGRELVRDGSYAMAEMMLTEARLAGLDEGRVELERTLLEDARNRSSSESSGRVRKILALARTEPIGYERAIALVEEIGQAASPEVVQLLIAAVGSDAAGERRIAVDALGSIGDARTEALYLGSRLPSVAEPRTLLEEWDGRLVETFDACRTAWFGGSDGPVRIDAVQMLCLSLLVIPDRRERLAEQVAIVEALGRLADPRSTVFVNQVRWAWLPGSEFWVRTARAFARLPIPEDLSPLEEAAIHHGRSDLAAARAAYDRAISAGENPVLVRAGRSLCFLEGGEPDRALLEAQAACRHDGDAVLALLARGRARRATGVPGAEDDFESARRAVHGRFRRLFLEAIQAHDLAAGGQVDYALERLDAILGFAPWLTGALLDRARLHLRAGRTAAAFRDVSAAIAVDPTRPEAWSFRAGLWSEEDARLAIVDATRAIELAPESADCRLARGDLRRAYEDHFGASEDYECAFELAPDRLDVHLRRIEIQYELHAFDAVIRRIDEAAARFGPSVGALLLRRARAHRLAGHFDEALADVSHVLRATPSAEAFVLRAQLWLGKREPGLALADLGHALDLDPADREARRERARLLVSLGEPARALEDLDHLVAPGDPQRLAHLRLRATARRQAGLVDLALADLDTILELTPEDPDLRLRRAIWRLNRRRHDEATADTERVLASDATDYHPTAILIASAIADDRGQSDAAAALLTRIGRTPDAAIYLQRAMFLWSQDDPRGAARDARRAIEMAPVGWPELEAARNLLEMAGPIEDR